MDKRRAPQSQPGAPHGNGWKPSQKHWSITLTTSISPSDTSWSFPISLPPLPPPDPTSSKIHIFLLTLTSSSITLSIEKQPTNRILSDPNIPLSSILLASFANFKFQDLAPKATTDYIIRFLSTGIKFRDNSSKTYIFYGHSNSQLKSKTCYLLESSSSSETLRKLSAFGDFANFTSTAKRAKRIGLLFTSAESSLKLKEELTKDIPDVEDSQNNFTDGCGLLSKRFATELAKARHIIFHGDKYLPSSYQIRYKGYKGMLMLNPALKEKAHFRASMKKFKGCGDDTFALLDYSRPFTYAYLNGELVTLLSSLGVGDEVFLKKQEEYFKFLEGALREEETAFQFLCYRDEMDLAERLMVEGSTEKVRGKIRKEVKEEWNGSYKKKEVTEGNERVRIWIRESRILFGVCDYTGTLKEGECHVRITTESGGHKSLFGAEVVVSRNPCLHPGDIRKFLGVENPSLSHLVDCIVFPIVGKRDPASLMSGGDLDGDKFVVFWDRDIIPQKLMQPYDYPPAREVPTRKISYIDMIKYFAGYNNASLGKVKNLYLEWAKVLPSGAASKQCQELNKLFSSCVDGEPIKIPEHLASAPPPDLNTKPFILDILTENVRKKQSSLFQEFPEDSDYLNVSSLQQLHNLLQSPEAPCLRDEFELFLLTLRILNKHKESQNPRIDIRDFLPYFDFGAFTTPQKYAVLTLIPTDNLLREQCLGSIFNGLFQSQLLSRDQLSRWHLDSWNVRWQLLYSSFDDDGNRLYSGMEKAMEHFEKKILIWNVDEQLTVALYIPKKVEKGTELDVGGERFEPHQTGRNKNSRIVKTVKTATKPDNPTLTKVRQFPTVKAFSFDPLSGNSYKKSSVAGYRLAYDGEVIQLYENRKKNTFIWFALNQKWQERNGIRRPTSCAPSSSQSQDKTQNQGHFKVSIALDKFNQDLIKSHEKVNKQASTGIELYVLSNRDRVAHDILDISMNQVDTTNVLQIQENIPRDYELPLFDNFDPGDEFLQEFPSFCKQIISLPWKDAQTLLDHLKDPSDLLQLINLCLYLQQQYTNMSTRFCDIFFNISGDNKLLSLLKVVPYPGVQQVLQQCLQILPELCIFLVENALSKLPLIPLENSNKEWIFSLIKSLLVASIQKKEICLELFRKLLKSLKFDITLCELTDLVKRILFTVRHANLTEEFLKLIFSEEFAVFDVGDIKEESEYARKFILALGMDYLGQIRENCPCDFQGVPLGAEEFINSNNLEDSNQCRSKSHFLSDFFNSNGDGPAPSVTNASDATASTLKPCQTNLEILRTTTPGLYQTILRTDIYSTLRNEDHIRFCVAKRPQNTPFSKNKVPLTVFDAFVHSIQDGKMELIILQDIPVELSSATWNLYCCGSTTNLNTELGAIKTLLVNKSKATSAYGCILGSWLTSDTSGPSSTEMVPVTPALVPLSGTFNPSQTQAISTSLTHPISLIWGPPGTGKTTVVVEILLQFLKTDPPLRILVTASTHNAVDNVMTRFLSERRKLGNSDSDDAIRLTSDLRKVMPSLKKWTLDAFVGKDIRTSDKAKGLAQKKLKSSRIVFSTCSGAGVGLLRDPVRLLEEKSVLSLDLSPPQDEHVADMFSRMDLDSKKLKKKLKNVGKFDIVIVDEASQITEPNALIPLVKSSKKAVLVGDHVQLCPTATEIGKQYDLQTSLFEKLYLSSKKMNKIMLDTQYRMHPQLVQFPSKNYYADKLKSGLSEDQRQLAQSSLNFPWPLNGGEGPLTHFPAVFVPCPTPEKKFRSSSSKVNEGQVKMTIEIVKMLKSGSQGQGLEIVVLTPYSKQKEVTENVLKSTGLSVEVNTVDGFQGREADIIIFVTVRANNHKSLGFLDDFRRINVAVTRARYGLIVVGYEETLLAGSETRGMIDPKTCRKVELLKK